MFPHPLLRTCPLLRGRKLLRRSLRVQVPGGCGHGAEGGRPNVVRFRAVFPVLVLVLGLTLLTAGFLEVEMAGRTQMVFLNENATIFCKIPGFPHLDINSMGITWFRKAQLSEIEIKLFEFFGDHKVAFRPGANVSPWRLKRGDASLQLPGVQLWEAGEYRCELVVTPQKAQGRVWLEVVAHPVSSLFLEQAGVKDNEDKHILCKSSGFYPEDINITWKRWTQKDPQFQEISEDVITGPTMKNEDGTFNITSYLRLKPSLEDNVTIYQCVVWHVSSLMCQSFNFTPILIESEKKTDSWIVWLYIGLISTGLIVLILFLYYFIWKLRGCKAKFRLMFWSRLWEFRSHGQCMVLGSSQG
ncbi:natural cytotoxicity triggering receptor 3 ligand 1 [Phocoena sinus]|uniref:Natural killer cell cytotoxicity receptor 3 ligand 1 n=1 Tax=Phocoena sinus TaxID=42100 RepID=A0A8C9BDV7_PHOSS|nr:natural cytotoxicity triggering receptor 3 ligand 1 [Phocoena sinus]